MLAKAQDKYLKSTIVLFYIYLHMIRSYQVCITRVSANKFNVKVITCPPLKILAPEHTSHLGHKVSPKQFTLRLSHMFIKIFSMLINTYLEIK